MFAYFFLQLLIFVHGKHWDLINSPMGYWYMLEMFGLVILQTTLFSYSNRKGNILMIKFAAVLTMIGVIINRLNVTLIGFKWTKAIRYVPTWMEFAVILAVIFSEIWIFRRVINRMPVLRESPDKNKLTGERVDYFNNIDHWQEEVG